MKRSNRMAILKVSEELAGEIKREATTRGLAVEEFLQAAIQRQRTLAARRKIEREQEWWLGLPLSERAKYEGEFVAVHNQQLIDHDKDASVLYKRIRARHGTTPILVMPAEGPREIRIFSPRLVSQ
jgi:hypothetical protein